jgi:outer membrane receptor for ferrienterochelin and colicin
MKKYLLFVFFSCAFSSFVFSQTGTIRGQVKDAATGETLIGASILIQGTSRGAITDFDGNFTLTSMEPGPYNLIISYISYDNQIHTVEVSPDAEVVLNVDMQPASIGVEEVTIVRRRRTDTEMAVICNLKSGDLIANAISAQQISKSLDSDAGEVIRRVPGVTITNGKFVIVRGLIERYNSVLFNGATAPSFESDKRAFSFDALPSGMIDNILIYKSPAPELPADFAGAAINIMTRSNADENSIRVGYTAEFVEGASFNKDFLTYKGGKTDWLGFDDGTRKFPSSLPSIEEVSQLYEWPDINEYKIKTKEITRFSRDFNSIWNPVAGQPFLDQSLNVTAQKRFVIGKTSLGNITAINYRARNRKTEIRRTEYQRYEPSIDSLIMNFNFLDQKSVKEYQLGLIHNWNFIYGRNQKLTFNNFLNNLGEAAASTRQGDDYYSVETIRMTNLWYNNRFIYSGQLAGIQEFNQERTHLNWLLGYSCIKNNKPDDRRQKYILDYDRNKYYLEIQNQPTNVRNGGRLDINLFERIYNGGLDFDHNFFTFTSENPWTVKAGGFYQYKYRVYNSRLMGVTIPRPRVSIDFYQPIEDIMVEDNFYFDSLDFRVAGLAYNDGTKLKDSYSAEDEITAGYLALKIPILKSINVYGGVRLEKYSRFLGPGDGSEPVKRDTLNYFPSLNITYSINEKHQFRFAYGKTVNRPEFREISSVDFEDFDLNLIIHGNSELKDAYIRNYDLRYEWYPSFGEMISVTGFYKKFRDPIEIFLIPAGTGYDYRPYNTEEATSFGVELDVRKTLLELENVKGLGFLKNLTIVFNTSLIKSEISTRKPFARDSVRIMQGQSPYIVNLGLFYNNQEHLWRINLNYNNVGKRIAFAGTPDNPHTWELARHSLDLSFHKEFGERFEIRVGVKDLINNPVRFVQYYGPGDSVVGDTYRWVPNRKFSAGLTVRL